jgi:hypothetical protein
MTSLPIAAGDAATAIVGAAATVFGVLVGAGLAYLVGVAQSKRTASVAAVVKCDLALRRFNVTDLSFEDQADRNATLDRSGGRLLKLESALAISRAQDALALVRVQYGNRPIAALAEGLDADLSRLAQRTSAWYALVVAHRDETGDEVQADIAEQFQEATRVRDRALERLAGLQEALGLTSVERSPFPFDPERPEPPVR